MIIHLLVLFNVFEDWNEESVIQHISPFVSFAIKLCPVLFQMNVYVYCGNLSDMTVMQCTSSFKSLMSCYICINSECVGGI